MGMPLKEHFLKQIDATIELDKAMAVPGQGLETWQHERLITDALAAIERITGKASVYMQQALAAAKPKGPHSGHPDYYTASRTVLSILESVRDAVAADYLDTASSLIHGSVFADFLEMAQHLLDEGYKDAAAVIAGSALEAHLRPLCVDAVIDTMTTNASGDSVPKKASRMNADLYAANVYSLLDQKSVTAWLDLRNKAAHGEYDIYVDQQVGLMISGIRDFITRVPA
jgi:hypothetical protein